jgi:hypothetical protein
MPDQSGQEEAVEVQRKLWRLFAPAVILALAALLSACGGGGDATTSIPPPTASSAPQKEQVNPIDAAATDLESAGLNTYPEDPADGQGAIVAGPRSNERWIKVTYYDDARQAAKAGKEVEAVYDNHPGQGLVTVIGHLFVNVGSERPLTDAEKEAFEEVVSVLEGSG